MKYNIEFLKEIDLVLTLELVKEVFDEFEAPYYSEEGVENFYKFANYDSIEKMLKENLKIIIAKFQSKIIGMVVFRDNSHISMLFVDKNYHRQGVATRLCNEAIKYCQDNNERLNSITVNSSPYAINFYEKLGFIKMSDEQIVDGIEFTPMKLNINNGKGKLKLIIPTVEYKEQVMEYRRIFLENNESFDGCAGLEEVNSYEEWIDFDNRLSEKYGESYVPSTVCLAVRINDNKLVGIIDFRYELSDFLLNYGGNIGYSVLPLERKKGYAKEMLRLMLTKCREFNKKRVLLTCDKENIASAKTIIANGGVLENEVIDKVNLSESGIIQRYWIDL